MLPGLALTVSLLIFPGYVLCHEIEDVDCTEVTYTVRYENMRLRGGVRLRRYARDHIRCMERCRADANCQSVNYNSDTMDCEMVDGTVDDTYTSLRYIPGINHYYLRDICDSEKEQETSTKPPESGERRVRSESGEKTTQEEILLWIIAGLVVVIVLLCITMIVFLCIAYHKQQSRTSKQNKMNK